MSRPSKPKSKGPVPAKTDAQEPAQVTPVTPVPTDAASAEAKAAAEAAAASVDPNLPKGPGASPDPVNAPDGTAPSQNGPDPAKDEAPKTKRAAQPVVLRVKGPAKGRWRAGRKFGPEEVDIPMADLSDEDLAALNGDPELTCTVIGAGA